MSSLQWTWIYTSRDTDPIRCAAPTTWQGKRLSDMRRRREYREVGPMTMSNKWMKLSSEALDNLVQDILGVDLHGLWIFGHDLNDPDANVISPPRRRRERAPRTWSINQDKIVWDELTLRMYEDRDTLNDSKKKTLLGHLHDKGSF